VKVVIKVSRRSNRVEVVQKRSLLKSPEEKNAPRWSAKESLPKSKIEQEGEGSCGRASEEVRGRVRRAQKVGRCACWQQHGRQGCRRHLSCNIAVGECGVGGWSLLKKTDGVVSCGASCSTIEVDPWKRLLCHSVTSLQGDRTSHWQKFAISRP